MSGVLAIAEALEDDAVLTSLDLSRNSIPAEGAKALSEAVKGRNGFDLLLS